jgi:flagellar basal body-associated protein FliL
MVRTKEIFAVFDMKQFMINTKDTDTQHLVRIKLQLAYKRENIKLLTELNQRRAQISDIILLFFKDKSKDQMDSSEKIQRLKEELKNGSTAN